MLEDEIVIRRVIVADDPNGPKVVIEPGTIRLEGPGLGWCIWGFDPKDGEAGCALVSKDGRTQTKLRAASDGAGLSIKRGVQSATLAAGGVTVGEGAHATITKDGITLKHHDGEVAFSLPFACGS